MKNIRSKIFAAAVVLVPQTADATSYDAYMVHGPSFQKSGTEGVAYDIVADRDYDGLSYFTEERYADLTSYAPVYLRGGSKIYMFTCGYRLSTPITQNVYLGAHLLRIEKATSRTEVIAKIERGGSATTRDGEIVWEDDIVTVEANNLVENKVYQYVVRLNIKNCFDGFCRLRYCRVSYSY